MAKSDRRQDQIHCKEVGSCTWPCRFLQNREGRRLKTAANLQRPTINSDKCLVEYTLLFHTFFCRLFAKSHFPSPNFQSGINGQVPDSSLVITMAARAFFALPYNTDNYTLRKHQDSAISEALNSPFSANKAGRSSFSNASSIPNCSGFHPMDRNLSALFLQLHPTTSGVN